MSRWKGPKTIAQEPRAVKEAPDAPTGPLSPRARIVLLAVPVALLAVVDLGLRVLGVNGAYRASRPTPIAREDGELMFRAREHLDVMVTPSAPLRMDRSGPLSPLPPFRVVTNSRGYRHPAELGPKAAGALRVICVGDSYTFGYGVNLEDTYAARLERVLGSRLGRPVEVVNVAQSGHSSAQGLRLWEKELRYLSPDVVTVSFGANDYGVGVIGYGTAARKLAAGTSIPQRMRCALLPSELFVLTLRAREALGQRISSRRRFELPAPEEVRGDPDACGRNVAEIARQAIAGGARAVVVTQARAPGDRNEPYYRAALRAAAPASGALLADASAAMDRAMAALPAPAAGWEVCPNRFFVDPTHLTPEGHEVVAREILAQLEGAMGAGARP